VVGALVRIGFWICSANACSRVSLLKSSLAPESGEHNPLVLAASQRQ
jgi:hypothetical protein